MRGRIVSNFCLAVNLHGCQRIARNQAFRVLFRYGVLAKRQIVDGIGINAFSILGKVRDIHRLLIARSIGAFLVADRKLQAIEDLFVHVTHTVIGLGDRQLADFLVIGVGYSDNSLIILGNGNVNLSVFGYSQVIAGNLCVFRVFHDNVRTYRQVLPFLGFTRIECNPLFIVSSCNRTVLLIVGNGRLLCTFLSSLGGHCNLEGLRRIRIGNTVGDLGYRQFANFFGVGIFNSARSRIGRRVFLGCRNSPAVCNCQIQTVLLCVCFIFLHRIIAHRQVFPYCNSSGRASCGNTPCIDRYPLGLRIIAFITLTGQRLSVRSIVDTVGILQGKLESPCVKIVADNLHCLGNLHIAAFLGVIVGYGDQFDVRLLSFSRFNIYGHLNTVCRNISVPDFNSETVFVPGITVNRRTVLIFFHIVGAGRQVDPCNLVRFSGLDFNPFVIPGYYRAVGGVVGRVVLIILAVDSHTEDLVCKSRICGLVFVHSNSFRNIQPAQVFRVLVGEEYLGKVCAGQGSGSGNTAGGNFRNLRGFAVPAYPVGYLRQGVSVDYRAVFLFSHGIGSQGQVLQHKHSVAEILIGKAGFRGLQFCPFAMQVFGIRGIIPHRIVCSSINLCCNGERQFFFLLIRQFHRYTVKGECLVDLEHVADQGVCNGDLPDLVRLIPGQVAVAYCIPVHFRFCYGIGDLFAIDVFGQVIPFNRQCRAGRIRRDSLLFGLCSGAVRLDFGNGHRSTALIFSAQREGYRRMIQCQSVFASPGLRCLDLRGVKRVIVFNCQDCSKFGCCVSVLDFNRICFISGRPGVANHIRSCFFFFHCIGTEGQMTPKHSIGFTCFDLNPLVLFGNNCAVRGVIVAIAILHSNLEDQIDSIGIVIQAGHLLDDLQVSIFVFIVDGDGSCFGNIFVSNLNGFQNKCRLVGIPPGDNSDCLFGIIIRHTVGGWRRLFFLNLEGIGTRHGNTLQEEGLDLSVFQCNRGGIQSRQDNTCRRHIVAFPVLCVSDRNTVGVYSKCLSSGIISSAAHDLFHRNFRIHFAVVQLGQEFKDSTVLFSGLDCYRLTFSPAGRNFCLDPAIAVTFTGRIHLFHTKGNG